DLQPPKFSFEPTILFSGLNQCADWLRGGSLDGVRRVRKSVLLACLCAGRAFADDEVGGIGRMGFADTPAFHSVFETRVPQPVEARRSASVSAKVRIAMWASGSTLPAQPESL